MPSVVGMVVKNKRTEGREPKLHVKWMWQNMTKRRKICQLFIWEKGQEKNVEHNCGVFWNIFFCNSYKNYIVFFKIRKKSKRLRFIFASCSNIWSLAILRLSQTVVRYSKWWGKISRLIFFLYCQPLTKLGLVLVRAGFTCIRSWLCHSIQNFKISLLICWWQSRLVGFVIQIRLCNVY